MHIRDTERGGIIYAAYMHVWGYVKKNLLYIEVYYMFSLRQILFLRVQQQQMLAKIMYLLRMHFKLLISAVVDFNCS